MQRQIWIPLLAAALAGTTQLQALDNDKKQEKELAAATAPADSITEGTVTVGGQAIAYKAVAGTITVGATNSEDALIGLDGKPLPDSGIKADKPEDAPATARIFYAAYFKKGAPAEGRPITFCYNGGPGSSTM